MYRLNKQTSGFTLIELLVVIAIIGILASVVMSSLNAARSKARDAKRIAEMRQIEIALEAYYADNGSYPNGCAGSTGVTFNIGYGVVNWSNILPSSYISTMPSDPLNIATEYGYYYCSPYKKVGCGYTSVGATNKNYIIGTRFENNSSGLNNCGGVSIPGWDNSNINHVMGTQ